MRAEIEVRPEAAATLLRKDSNFLSHAARRDHDAVPTPAVIYLTALPALGSTDWDRERLLEALGANLAKDAMVAHAARLAGLQAVEWGCTCESGIESERV